MPQTTDAAYCCSTESLQPDVSNTSSVFETKEEFISHLIEIHEIKKDLRHYSDNMIHLRGTLKVDARVKKGLNWNDVVVTSAIVEKGMITRYQYLPKTSKGVKTNLPIPSLELYMRHNNFEAECTDNCYHVNVLRIPEQASQLNFSSVSAKLTLFYGSRIALSKLPKSKGILGLSMKNLEVDCSDAYRVAKTKGCGAEILRLLKPRNPIFGCFYQLIGKK